MKKNTGRLIQPTVTETGIVRAWSEEILLPTYEVGEEEKHPIFLEKRVYQGSSGSVYPYPVIEKICDRKKDKPYHALFLENYYLKIMILPQLGGRIQMAYDKTNNRHFVYYNQVIKPALVGLAGPWISGGIEFNWPQHHRPSTFLPVDCLIKENMDGSKTVWCSEVERMSRTKGMHGITLYPDKAYIEIDVRVYNRTPLPQTFLWWANPAVAANDAYKSIFPPDVHAVFDHGKRDVSTFPIATGTYYKQDYSKGVDISKYKNIPVPTSYMAIESEYDFVGGYDDDAQAGLLHVADHHISTGKKQWTWGNGDFGMAWNRNLTDEDGPYIELMTGVYTDNQPDFSWLQPFEEKCWKQYFMPYTKVGYVKNATKDAAVNLEHKDGKAIITLYASSGHRNLSVALKNGDGCVIFADRIDISPSQPYEVSVETGNPAPESLLFELKDRSGKLMLSYAAGKRKIAVVSNPAKAALQPCEIRSTEQLFLTGLHLEQYRHATYNPEDYYKEALAREPGDIRCNNAMGLMLLRKGRFSRAIDYFRRAIETLTDKNPNPYDGEPFYNLGLALQLSGKIDEAYDAFFKATWNEAWQSAGFFSLAQIDCMRLDWENALEKIDRSLLRNGRNHRARHLKVAILRKLERKEAALSLVGESLEVDPFNFGCHFEKYLLTDDPKILSHMENIANGLIHPAIEYTLDYMAVGHYAEAALFLNRDVHLQSGFPMVYYTLGYNAFLQGKTAEAKRYYQEGSRMSPGKCFPNRPEEVNILQNAIMINPGDSKALYYLGNFWYAARQYRDAVACWEKSVALDDKFPSSLRNLSLAYYNKEGQKEKARQYLEQAYRIDPSDTRILMELDLLYKKTGMPYPERLAFLERHLDILHERDDLYLERVALYNQLGDYRKAGELIASHRFHPWEGGEGKVPGQYKICNLQLAKAAIEAGAYDEACRLLHNMDRYPENLGEGKLANSEENDVDYYKGVAYAACGKTAESVSFFLKATRGSQQPEQAFYYNDQQPDNIFYQGLAWQALGDEDKAAERFNTLIEHGEKHMNDHCRIDYFAVSLPDLAVWEDDLDVRNKVHCNYVIGLGCLGLRDKRATGYLQKVLELDVNHQGARIHLKMVEKLIPVPV